MIVRSLSEVAGTERDVRGDGWRAQRLLVRDDGMGFSLSETTLDAGARMDLCYRHHLEACYCVAGEAEVTERDTGVVHRIVPGTLYAPEHDRHTIRVISPLRLVCVFNPALTGRETHDADGGYLPAED